jgi:stage III sporulation protein AF
MIGELRTWIIGICTTVIFITAIEMILPNNSLKKYAKFVLGLILMAVLVNPIIRLFDKGFNIDDYANKAVKYLDEKGYETNIDKYKQESLNNTMSTFKLNLETICEQKLKEKFPNSNYKVTAAVGYDKDVDSAYIKSLKVVMQNGKIETVRKVDINIKGDTENGPKSLSDERSRVLKEYLSKELNIASNTIEVYKN